MFLVSNLEHTYDNSFMSAGIDQQTLEKLAHIFGLCLYKLNLDTKDINLTLNTTRITGHDLDSLPNNDDTKGGMIYSEDIDLVNNSIASIVSGSKDHYHIEYRMHRRDSSIVWIDEVGLISEYDENGHPLYMSALAADMSRLRWAEEKGRALEAKLHLIATDEKSREYAEENRLLRTANTAAAMIVGGFHQDYETVLYQAISMLGEGLQADYAGIWRNTKRTGELYCYLRSHWTKRAREVGVKSSDVVMRYDDFLPDWNEKLVEDAYLNLDISELPHEFRTAFDLGDYGNLLLSPFYLHGDFWGMIGFIRTNNAPFEAFEAETIMSGAIIIAYSVSRNEALGRLSMDRDRAIADTVAKGEFLSRMSHELRTPLNAVIGMTSIALREQHQEKVSEHLKKIESSSRLLLNVINDVLEMSKIEAGKLEIVKEPFDFTNIMRNAEDIVRFKFDEKNQKFSVNVDKSMNRKIISDEHRLLQVIVNLLNNAQKFTPENGEISLTAFERRISDNRAKLRVEVTDNGIGLTIEQQKRLFTAFEQADGSITRKYGGTGLGLAICKKILNALGGDIWVKSKPEEGACFFFELEVDLDEPIDVFAANDAADRVSAPISDKNDVPRDWRGSTILLAEDVEINREIVEIMLADTGISIISVENGRDAVDVFSKNPDQFDLILMDVQMPVMDGLNATKHIRLLDVSNAGNIPIIAMTANAFKEDVDDCLKAGMNGHISKPFAIEDIYKILDRYL